MGQAKPPAERPAGVIGQFDAVDAEKKIRQVVESAPECFEGEDLTVAQSLVSRLEEFSRSNRSLMGLSEEDEKVLKRGLACAIELERSKAQAAAGKPAPEAAGGGFPIVPVAIGAGVGAILLVLILS